MDWASGGRGCRSTSAASRKPRSPVSRMSPRSPWAIASDARVYLQRRCATLLALFLILPAAPAPSARAAGSLSGPGPALEVHPVAPPEAILRAQRAGRTPRALAMTPAERATLEARMARQKQFLPLEAELHRRAARVGAGLSASRRPGWRLPSAGGVRRFATDGAAPPP